MHSRDCTPSEPYPIGSCCIGWVGCTESTLDCDHNMSKTHRKKLFRIFSFSLSLPLSSSAATLRSVWGAWDARPSVRMVCARCLCVALRCWCCKASRASRARNARDFSASNPIQPLVRISTPSGRSVTRCRRHRLVRSGRFAVRTVREGAEMTRAAAAAIWVRDALALALDLTAALDSFLSAVAHRAHRQTHCTRRRCTLHATLRQRLDRHTQRTHTAVASPRASAFRHVAAAPGRRRAQGAPHASGRYQIRQEEGEGPQQERTHTDA
jgi:hypothetical protein